MCVKIILGQEGIQKRIQKNMRLGSLIATICGAPGAFLFQTQGSSLPTCAQFMVAIKQAVGVRSAEEKHLTGSGVHRLPARSHIV